MAVPAPAIPAGNAYTVNVARPSGDASPLSPFAFAAARLLRRWKIPVRMHLAGDSASTNALRARLNDAGGRPSGFSPAPSASVPGEGFWKTTLIVVEGVVESVVENPGNPEGPATATRFWADDRDDKKVEWDPLMIVLADDATFAHLPPAHIARPDLWIVALPEREPEPEPGAGAGMEKEKEKEKGQAEEVLRRWRDAGAGAVCLVSRDDVHWHTGNAVFGRSTGARARPTPPHTSANTEADTGHERTPSVDGHAANNTCDVTFVHHGAFAAGIVAGLMRDLLSENLFDKTLLRVDRSCLEMRPLRLGVAVADGLAAMAALEAKPHSASAASAPTPAAGIDRDFSARAEAVSVSLKGPPSRPWAHKGR